MADATMTPAETATKTEPFSFEATLAKMDPEVRAKFEERYKDIVAKLEEKEKEASELKEREQEHAKAAEADKAMLKDTLEQ